MPNPTPKNIRTINAFLQSQMDNPKHKAMVEAELGAPIKVSIDWQHDRITWQGSMARKVGNISMILRLAKHGVPQ